MTPASGVVQCTVVGLTGGTTAGLIYGLLTVGPPVAASGLIGALAGLTAGLVWIATNRLGRPAPVA